MMRHARTGLTLTEMIAVIGIIGVLFWLLLPAIQNARERARQMMCASKLIQLAIAVQNYEDAVKVYPPGTIDATGPINNLPNGYHHNWIEQILPYMEMRNVYSNIKQDVSIYDATNFPVRSLNLAALECPSSPMWQGGFSYYAGVHHHSESPIDEDNQGIFFLNSHVRHTDVYDGHANTLFLGEKLPLAGDMGWLSGSRATLRNTGNRINSLTQSARRSGYGRGSSAATSQGFVLIDLSSDGNASDDEVERTTVQIAAGAPIVNGLPTNPTAVGGFESYHLGGVNFGFGDGSLRFVRNTIDMAVYQRLGHRADGQLLSEDF